MPSGLGSWLLGVGRLGPQCLSTTHESGARLGTVGVLAVRDCLCPSGKWSEEGAGKTDPRLSLPRRPFAVINAPLCATIQTLWLLKNPFFPLEKSSCGEQLPWQPTAPRLPPPCSGPLGSPGPGPSLLSPCPLACDKGSHLPFQVPSSLRFWVSGPCEWEGRLQL